MFNSRIKIINSINESIEKADKLIYDTLPCLSRKGTEKDKPVSDAALKAMKAIPAEFKEQKKALADYRGRFKWNLFAKVYLAIADYFQRIKMNSMEKMLNDHLSALEKMKKMDAFTEKLQIAQPLIDSDDWGTITIAGKTYKDAVILPSDAERKNRVSDWNWKTADVHHAPGVSINAVDTYIFNQMPGETIDVVILSTGRGHGGKRENDGPGVLQIQEDVEAHFKSKGIKEVHILKTAAACEKYNELVREEKRVAALIHTTC